MNIFDKNCCWFCIHFWIKWELRKTFDAKMIGWTHFSDLKIFANSWPSASNIKNFSRSLEQFFHTVGHNNFGNKIPIQNTKICQFRNLYKHSVTQKWILATRVYFRYQKASLQISYLEHIITDQVNGHLYLNFEKYQVP